MVESAVSTPLPLDSAVLLMHGWCSARFRAASIRALFVKGPTLSAQGLRPARSSTDVDVLAHPDDFERVCALLRSNGWIARPRTFAARFYDDHSISFIHSRWPCDVDVHRRYPGFLAEPAVVFDYLWERRTTLTFADIPCDVSSRSANALIMGLHALRGATSGSRHRAELTHLLEEVAFDDADRQELADLAAATGSRESAAALLSGLAVPRSALQPAPVSRAAAQRWAVRVATADAPVWVWFDSFRHVAGRQRLLVVWRALWPSRSDLAAAGGADASTWPKRLTLRLQRVRRGIPAAARYLRLRWTTHDR